MESIKPGTLSTDGICFDYAIGGDGEYRIPPSVEEEPEMDLESDEAPGVAMDDAPEDGAPAMYIGEFHAHLNRLRC